MAAGLATAVGLLEGGDLQQAQDGEQHQPDQPATEQPAADLAPHQAGAGHAAEQHEQGRRARAEIKEPGTLDGNFAGVEPQYIGAAARQRQGLDMDGHRRLFL